MKWKHKPQTKRKAKPCNAGKKSPQNDPALRRGTPPLIHEITAFEAWLGT
ncbi:MAG: hypothetical protein IPL59_17380 [Candidatus Competibacteraceae bacterium]|nr:hypothetical protein [Candidatus Competibacteraceae bacterium]